MMMTYLTENGWNLPNLTPPQDPANKDQQRRYKNPQEFRYPGSNVLQKELFENHEDAVINAPEHKVPGRTVPQAGEQPDHG